MLATLVRIPPRHLERAVAERLGHFGQARAVHGQVARRRVTEIMDARVRMIAKSSTTGSTLSGP